MAWYDGVMGAVSDIGTGVINYISQKQNLDYQKSLQQEIFAREDTAMQRAMADAQKAGLNPQLAAGNGAGAGSIVSTEAPQLKQNGIGAYLDTQLAKESIKQAREQTAMAKLKVDEQSIKNAWLNDEKSAAWASNQFKNLSSANNLVLQNSWISNLFNDNWTPNSAVTKNSDGKHVLNYWNFENAGPRATKYFNSKYDQYINQGERLVRDLVAKDLYNAYMFQHGKKEEKAIEGMDQKSSWFLYDEILKGIDTATKVGNTISKFIY